MNRRLFSTLSIAFGLAAIGSAQTHYYFYQSNGGTLNVAPIGGSATTSLGGATVCTPEIFNDINPVLDFSGQNISRFQWAMWNGNTVSVNAEVAVTLMKAEHTTIFTAGGTPAPSNLLATSTDVYFNAIALTAGQLGIVQFTVPATTAAMTIPVGKFWMGQAYWNYPLVATVTQATQAQVDMLGIAFTTPARGASEPEQFLSTPTWWDMPYLDPAGTMLNITTSSGSQPYFNLAVAGQAVPFSISLQDVGPMAYQRPMTITAMVGTTALYSNTVLVGTASSVSAVTANFPVTMPAGVSGAASIVLEGASFPVSRTRAELWHFDQANLGVINIQNGDVDLSGEVDAADIDSVIADFSSIYPGGPNSNNDVDVSGEVDAADIDVVIANFGGLDDI